MKFPARKNLRAFTLIELLIVIAILGILAAAVLIAVNPAKRQRQAKDATVKADIGSVATALQAYYTAPGQGAYPLALADLVTNQDLKTIPIPPSGAGAAYTYAVTPAGCDNTGTNLCTEASLSGGIQDPTTAGAVLWCWRSAIGTAAEAATCAP